MMNTITIDKIETGDLLFLKGDSWLAEQIKKSQKEKGNKYWCFNHVGVFLMQGSVLCVAEEDFPGVFDINMFKTEYIDEKKSVYLGRYTEHQLTDEGKLKLQCEFISDASEDRLTNYGYIDILSFKLNSFIFKKTGKNIWFGRKINKNSRYTCSQRTAKYLQDYFDILKEKNYMQYTPADIADDVRIELFKIIY